MRHHIVSTVFISSLALLGCSEQSVDLDVTGLTGEVHLVGPVSGATVELYTLDERGAPLFVAQTTTGEDGTFALPGLEATGDLWLEVEVGGRPWLRGETEGRYPEDLVLRSPVADLRPLEHDRAVQVTPLTTLVMAIAEGRRRSGLPLPFLEVQSVFQEWLGFDPVSTRVGPRRGGDRDATRHRLLLEAFVQLAGRIADDVGVPPDTSVTAAELLVALEADALGPNPAAYFDGLGAGGPVVIDGGPARYPLGVETLRDKYGSAILDVLTTDGWSHLTSSAVADLTERVRCGEVPIHGPCEESAFDDPTPAAIQVDPPADELIGGVVVIEVSAHDPDSGIRDMEVLRKEPRDLPPVVLADRDDRPGVANVVVEVDRLLDRAELALLVRVTNGGGRVDQFDLTWPLSHGEPGVLRGHVIKGPAENVTVRLQRLRTDGGEPVLITQTTTDANGAFEVETNWRGALRLVATSHGDLQSVYYDEARHTMRSWNGELVAIVPRFDPDAPPPPVMVTPLTHLAAARAEASQQLRLVDAYRESLGLLAEHFGLTGGAHSALHLKPARMDDPWAGLDEAGRYLIALGCLSRQALDVEEEAYPGEGFSALDLVDFYARDLAVDGVLNGGDGLTLHVIDGGRAPVTLEEGLRRDLAVACVRWLDDPLNPLPIEAADVLQHLQRLTTNTSALFDPLQAPEPFDGEGPQLAVTLEPGEGGARHGEHYRGPVLIRVHAADDAGITELSIDAPGLQRIESPFGEDQKEGAWLAHVDTAALGAGPHAVVVNARDAFGNGRDVSVNFEVDNAAPTLELDAPPGARPTAEGWMVTAAEVHIGVRTDDQLPVQLSATVDGVDAVTARDGVRLTPAEGRVELMVRATDALGHATEVRQTLLVDRSRPVAAFAPTAYRDERPLGVQRVLGAAPAVPLDDGARLTKWQTTWHQGGEGNPIELQIEVADGPDETGTPAAELDVTWWPEVDGRARDPQPLPGAHLRTIELTADALGIDPQSTPPAPDTPVTIHVRVRDRLGNESLLQRTFHLDVVPPPVRIEPAELVDLPGHLRYDQITLGDASFGQIMLSGGGSRIALSTIRVTNPHDVPVRLELAGDARWQTEFGLGYWVEGVSDSTLLAGRRDHDGRVIQEEGELLIVPAERCWTDAVNRGDRVWLNDLSYSTESVGDSLWLMYRGTCSNFRDGFVSEEQESTDIEVWSSEGGVASVDRHAVVPARGEATLTLTTRDIPDPLHVNLVIAAGDEHYRADIQQSYGLTRVEADEHCGHRFRGEPGQNHRRCQAPGLYFGHRYYGLKGWRMTAQGDWGARVASADGALRGLSFELMAPAERKEQRRPWEVEH